MRLLLILLATLLLIVGCGGGGGTTGGGQTATLVGRIIWVETNASPDPPASVTSGSASVETDKLDGSFNLEVNLGATSITVSYAASGSSTPVVRSFTFPPAQGTVDLGDLYIGPEEVTLIGTVEDASTNLPVEGALIKIAGRSGTTNASGDFSIPNVAYSSSNPAAFGDIVGEITKFGYVRRLFNPPTAAVNDEILVGTLTISPTSSDTPPPTPANLTGTIQPVNDGAGATVNLMDGLTVVRTTVADGAGQYQFWAPVGTYTIEASNGGKTGSEPVTLNQTNVQKVVNVTIQ